MRTHKPRLLINGMKGFGQKHIAAALLDALDGHHVQSFDLAILMGDSVRVSCISSVNLQVQNIVCLQYGRRRKQYVCSCLPK
jgi:hypothetical protein